MTTTPMGERIRHRREIELNLTRPEFAARLAALGYVVRPQQVYRWECKGAVPGLAAVSYIERALDVPAGWLGNGQGGQPTAGTLTHSQLIALLDRCQATPQERLALQRHLASLEAANERITDAYCVGFLNGLRTLGLREAFASAVTAQAAEAMRAEGRHPLPPRPAPRDKRTGPKRRRKRG